MPIDTHSTLNAWRFCVAPMMEWSDRHCRYLWRLMSAQTRLYTEMVVSGAILHGDRERFLHYNQEEHPLALQLGGSSPHELAECAAIATEYGYDEINLNCGCPSDRVQKGKIGAILMQEAELVAECVHAMRAATHVPVTVKHRIGIDDHDDYTDMARFVEMVASSGCDVFIVHARKAWLQGLSPKENREVPPLNYDSVIRLKKDFPALTVVINGGVTTIDQSQKLLDELDGVMVGREAYSNPYLLADIDHQLFGSTSHPIPSRKDIAIQYAQYCQQQLALGSRLHHMSRHILGLFAGQRGGKQFRRYISQHAHKTGADESVLFDALSFVD